MKLRKSQTALVIVDVQEAFRNVIPDFASIASSIAKTVEGFKVLGCPVVITEQYPKGLGHTVHEISEIVPTDSTVFEKSSFSACGNPDFVLALRTMGVEDVLLCGVETHICVNQSANDLLVEGFSVHLLEDCVGSRTAKNRSIGIDKIFRSGGIPSSVEMSLFELLGDSRNENFKVIQSLIK